MGRYIGPVCRICRREGKKLFLKGTKCDTDKCPMERETRKKPPGEPPKRVALRTSEYKIRLREKQKLKFIYGVSERQFKKYYKLALREKEPTGIAMLKFLERRLDNVVYKLGFASSHRQARQLVSHGHICVNNRKVDIPSYLVSVGEKISPKEKSKAFINTLKVERTVPAWLELNKETLEAKVLAIPKREEIPVDIDENLVVEFYSRR